MTDDEMGTNALQMHLNSSPAQRRFLICNQPWHNIDASGLIPMLCFAPQVADHVSSDSSHLDAVNRFPTSRSFLRISHVNQNTEHRKGSKKSESFLRISQVNQKNTKKHPRNLGNGE
jgi:hypothetical protein